MRRRNLLVSSILSILVLAACSSSVQFPEVETPTSAPASTSTSTTLPSFERQAVDWFDPAVVAEFEGGWAVHACEGDAPLLCVERHGDTVGTIDAMAYSMSSFDDLDPSDDAATNLRRFAEGFIESLGDDRAAGCGADYQFTPLDAESFPIGGAGVFYGFEGRLANGSPSELNLQYATIVGDSIVTMVAIAYDDDGCPGRDDTSGWESATLAEFRPWLERVLVDSPLPDIAVAP